ncbi:MAG: hypothetical protein JXR48_03185 [Candidatus Delongbacteria bacterium]|nr:hypothetical protein [Candidatus Delongbacteria bacterium]MBN2833951.1 hypothetical protein [Candidatus Delongbacteria bacterium]
MKFRLFFLIIFVLKFSTLSSEELLNNHEKLNSQSSSPAYENVDYFKDYRLSQAIKSSIKWTEITVVTSFIATQLLVDDGDDKGIQIAINSIVGATLGFTGGAIYGYIKGSDYNKSKAKNVDFHLNKYRFGHEYVGIAGLTDSNRPTPKYYLTYQDFNSKLYEPSEYRIGFCHNSWDSNRYSSVDAREKKLDISLLFNSNNHFLNPYFGIGAGYSWGNYDTYKSDDEIVNNDFIGFSLIPTAGLSINFLDFFFTRLEVNYELSSFFYKLKNDYDLPYDSNLNFSISFGSYLF